MPLFLDITDPSRGDTLLTLLRAHGSLWLTAALGCAGIYGLLPRARRSRPIWAGLATATALVLAGLWLLHLDGVWPERVLFYAFSLLAVAGGVMMLAQSNPVHAALSFALVVLSVCGLFLLLAAPFLMAATIIIYAGAIVVTFLFVIMLAQQAGLASADVRSREPFLASLAGFILLGSLWCVIDKTYNAEPMLRHLDELSKAQSWDEVVQLASGGTPAADDRTMPAVQRLQQALPGELHPMVLNLENAWAKKDLGVLTKISAQLRDEALKLQAGAGKLKKPDVGLPPEPALTASNVSGLGRVLFTRYLVPVELAGVLLLVATIGAIVIAGQSSRRKPDAGSVGANETPTASEGPP